MREHLPALTSLIAHCIATVDAWPRSCVFTPKWKLLNQDPVPVCMSGSSAKIISMAHEAFQIWLPRLILNSFKSLQRGESQPIPWVKANRDSSLTCSLQVLSNASTIYKTSGISTRPWHDMSVWYLKGNTLYAKSQSQNQKPNLIQRLSIRFSVALNQDHNMTVGKWPPYNSPLSSSAISFHRTVWQTKSHQFCYIQSELLELPDILSISLRMFNVKQ